MWPRNLDEGFRFDGGLVRFLIAVFSGLRPAALPMALRRAPGAVG